VALFVEMISFIPDLDGIENDAGILDSGRRECFHKRFRFEERCSQVVPTKIQAPDDVSVCSTMKNDETENRRQKGLHKYLVGGTGQLCRSRLLQ